MSDPIERQDAINEALKCRVIEVTPAHMLIDKTEMVTKLLALPSAQPDLSSYSDKLWRNAYERGKIEAEAEIIYCEDCVHHIDGFFCQAANHHTSDNDCCASVFGAERRTDD